MRTLEIRMKPIGKARPRFTRGRTYTPQTTKDAENLIACAWVSEHGREYVDGPVRLSIVAEYAPPASWSAKKRQDHFGKPKVTKPDADNVFKLVSDALNGIAYSDDARIAGASIAKIYGPEDIIKITVEGL